MVRTKKEAFISKVETAAFGASGGAAIGTIVGGPVGGTVGSILGGVGGLIFGDTPIVFSEPMICIPAREQYKLSSEPSYMIYAHAGESLIPTGGNIDDTAQGVVEVATIVATTPKRKVSRYNREFGRQLKSLKKKHPNAKNLMKRAHAATRKKIGGK